MPNPTNLMTMTAVVVPRVVAAEPDEYGNDVETDGTPFDTSCFIWQDSHRLAASEDTGPENITTDQYSGAFPPDDPISANSKITVEGVAYEVDGDPWPFFNPRTKVVTHQELSLKRVA